MCLRCVSVCLLVSCWEAVLALHTALCMCALLSSIWIGFLCALVAFVCVPVHVWHRFYVHEFSVCVCVCSCMCVNCVYNSEGMCMHVCAFRVPVCAVFMFMCALLLPFPLALALSLFPFLSFQNRGAINQRQGV